jgi:hypothetical protein
MSYCASGCVKRPGGAFSDSSKASWPQGGSLIGSRQPVHAFSNFCPAGAFSGPREHRLNAVTHAFRYGSPVTILRLIQCPSE